MSTKPPVGLEATHLVPAASTDEQRAIVERAADVLTKPPEDPKKLAMRERAYTFNFEFTDHHGKRFDGIFTNVAPSFQMKSRIGVLRAQLNGALPFSSIDPDTDEMNAALAHMTFTLEKRPDWAKDLTELEDDELLKKLWAEVALHEATFRKRP